MNFGGIMNTVEIKPGTKFTVSIPLARYCKFDAPAGTRSASRTTLAGRKSRAGSSGPVAEGSVTFRMPTPEQAKQSSRGWRR